MNSFGAGRGAGALAGAGVLGAGAGALGAGATGAGVAGDVAGGAEGAGADAADVVAGRLAQPVTISPSSNDITMRCPARISMTPPSASPRGNSRLQATIVSRQAR
ncbi:MAG: hypothetical protein DME04_20435 [Candidatus Rokuibacteriota bacterium]|nr:MAG: hypothetical protein DME04_20435 [Candidatus Rokubacteria bacterium]